MKDYQACIKKLRTDAAEAALIRDLTADGAKREVFNRVHQHLCRLADEVERATSGQTGSREPVSLEGSSVVGKLFGHNPL